jgi:cardiolipin synthase
MIYSAKENICIQTPYFIPDELMLGALSIAKKSGVRIDVIIPCKPDKKFVYNVTLSYVKDMIKSGINFYLYKGFIHSKLLIIDNKIVSIGTCNLDSRSFSLNFEINTFLYGESFGKKTMDQFKKDLQNSKQVDSTYFKRKPWLNKLGQAFFRLFSPLL